MWDGMDLSGSVADHFDALSAQTIFWETVPVLLHRHDREDSFEELSVRLLTGHTRQNHALKILRVHIFNDNDLFFLHTLEVSEEDFQTLKVEQGILVDFVNFSGKIIDLLKRCIASRGEEVPRFRAVLVIGGGESTFKMVETNDFKQLAHISLCFRPGTDLAIKSFLAFRLTEMQRNCESLQADLQNCQQDLAGQNVALKEQHAAFKEMESRQNRTLMESEAASKDAVASARQAHVQEREDMVAAFERTKLATHEQHVKQVSVLQDRTTRLDTENRELREQKYNVEAQVAELRLKLSSAEQRSAGLHDEVNHLQKQAQALTRERGELQIELTDMRSKLLSCTERANMQEKVMQQQAQRVHDLEASNKQLDSRCMELREAATGHEHRAKEALADLAKSNQTTDRISADLQISKEKLKRKQTIIVRQEEEVHSRDQALEAAGREVQDLKRQQAANSDDAERLQTTINDLRSKLEESKQQLKGNEQMIRWLNTQVNEAQLAVSRAPTSRYSFRPSLATSADVPTGLPYARDQGLVAGHHGMVGGPTPLRPVNHTRGAPSSTERYSKATPGLLSPQLGDSNSLSFLRQPTQL